MMSEHCVLFMTVTRGNAGEYGFVTSTMVTLAVIWWYSVTEDDRCLDHVVPVA